MEQQSQVIYVRTLIGSLKGCTLAGWGRYVPVFLINGGHCADVAVSKTIVSPSPRSPSLSAVAIRDKGDVENQKKLLSDLESPRCLGGDN